MMAVLASIVMGIDPSLTSTGVVMLDKGGSVLRADTIRVSGRGVERLWAMKEAFYQFISRVSADLAIDDHGIAIAVLEGYGYSRQQQKIAELGEWVGQIKMTLYDFNIPIAIIPPARLKKFAAGKGNAQKDEMRLAVFKRWGFEAKENDLVDAYALAQLGRALFGWEPNLTKAQREVVDAVRAQEVPA